MSITTLLGFIFMGISLVFTLNVWTFYLFVLGVGILCYNGIIELNSYQERKNGD